MPMPMPMPVRSGTGRSAASGAAGATTTAHDLRTVPLALGAWLACWLGTAGDGRLLLAVLVAGLGLGSLAVLPRSPGRPSRWITVPTRPGLVALALVLVVCGSLGALQAHRLRSGPVAALARQQAGVSAQVEIRSDAHRYPAKGGRPALVTVRAQVREVSGRGAAWKLRAPVLVLASGDAAAGWADLPVGSVATVTARLKPGSPGEDVAAVLQVRGPPSSVRPPGPGLRVVERVRDGLRRSVAERRPEPRALVPALVLGDTAGLTPDLQAAFQTTGLTHLTAVSGANLTLLLAFLLLAARWLGVRGWALRGVGLGGVVVFVALCRTEPSVLRAAAMGLVALAALGSGSRRSGLRNLAVAMVLLLLLDPYLGRSWGFALSVLASAGIIWWARPWAEVLGRWTPRLLADAVALPLAAHLATVPVVAALSGTVSAVGLVANAVAGPLVGPATVLGFAAAGGSLVSSRLAAVLGFGAAWAAQLIIWVARSGAELPGAALPWPTTPVALGLLAGTCLVAAALVPWVLCRRWLTLALAVLMTVALLRAPVPPGWPPQDWRFVACDVGQGDGEVLWAGRGTAVVVDSGPDPVAMRRCLDGLGVRAVPLLVLTHFHADHVDGLAGVFEGRRVGEVWVSPRASPAGEAAAARELAGRHGVPVRVPPPGTRAQVGGISLAVLGPLTPQGVDADDSAAENDASLVVLADVEGLRVLLTGDVEPPGQRALLSAGADLRAQVLKVPHHGSARQEPAFFAATGATVAVTSSGVDNDYGHPAAGTLQLARSLGMTVLRTDQNGTAAIGWRHGKLAAVTQRPP